MCWRVPSSWCSWKIILRAGCWVLWWFGAPLLVLLCYASHQTVVPKSCKVPSCCNHWGTSSWVVLMWGHLSSSSCFPIDQCWLRIWCRMLPCISWKYWSVSYLLSLSSSLKASHCIIDISIECFNIRVAAGHKWIKVAKVRSKCYWCGPCGNDRLVRD